MSTKQEFEDAIARLEGAVSLYVLTPTDMGELEAGRSEDYGNARAALLAIWPGEGAAPERVAALERVVDAARYLSKSWKAIISDSPIDVISAFDLLDRGLDALDAAPRDRVGEGG